MTATEKIVRTLKAFGWEANQEFWEKYHTDPWVYNLTSALVASREPLRRSNDMETAN